MVIVHLAPDHNSELAAIIGTCTKTPVVEASDKKPKLKPDHVYVISPDHKLEISDTNGPDALEAGFDRDVIKPADAETLRAVLNSGESQTLA